MNKKHEGLRLVAASLRILAWIIAGSGFVSSILLGIAASAIIPKVYMLLGGLVVTAITTSLLLALSGIIYVLVDTAEELHRVIGVMKSTEEP